MDRETPQPRFKSPIIAALETAAERRLKESEAGAESPPAEINNIDRAAAIVEAGSAKIKANDFSAVETLFAGQGFALDAMFDKLARDPSIDCIRLALRAQGHCRATFIALMRMKNPQVENFLRKRSVEPAKSPSRAII